MSFQAEDTGNADPERLVHFDDRQRTYALTIPNHPTGGLQPIGYCPWCGAKLPRGAPTLTQMTPEICRQARKAVSMTHRQVADAIGESLRTVYLYEMGKPTDHIIVEKLLSFFQPFSIAPGRKGQIGWRRR